MQIWKQLRDRHVHEAEMSGVSVKEVFERWHEARMRSSRGTVCREKERKESPERER